MKKHLILFALTSFTTPLLAATIPFTNATQCTCTLKHQNDHFLTCSIQSSRHVIFVGKIKNEKFIGTAKLTPGQKKPAPITLVDQEPVVAYNSDDSSADYESADFSDFHYPAALTLVHLFDRTSSIDYPVESRCINTQTCTYLKAVPGCLHSNITVKH
jgi:hypothetical protein